jgi:hypothetical protein
MGNVLGVSFSSRIIGFAVFENDWLVDWRIHSFFNPWSEKKLKAMVETVASMVEQNSSKALAIKLPDALPVSKSFMQIVGSVNTYFERKQIPVYYFTISEIKKVACKDVCASKRRLMDCILARYPDLAVEYKKECDNGVPYYDKVFEAVGAAYTLIRTS